MSYLIPTPVVDKNGKLTTVHKKASTVGSAKNTSLPVVTLPIPAASKAELLQAMMEIFGVGSPSASSSFFSRNIGEWLDSSTPEQLAELSVVIDALGPLNGFDDDTDDPAVKRERVVIRSIMNETIQNRTNRIHAHDMLAVRSALCSDYARIRKLPLGQAFSHFLGLISKDGHILPPSERTTNEKLISGIRFAYELGVRLSDYGSMPTMSSTVTSIDDSGDVKALYASEYKSPELLELVMSNADRVDELIDLAEARNSCDPSLLKELLNSEAHRAMQPGWL